MDPLAPLLDRTVVLVAHPDDESLAGVLLQRMREPHVVIATDGAPRDPYFWQQYGSREAYRDLRKREVAAAMGELRVKNYGYLSSPDAPDGFADQELFRNIPAAARALEVLLDAVQPRAMLTMTYEGGHPDHDTCSFLGSVMQRRRGLAVWEMPLYCRNEKGERVLQSFGRTTGSEVQLQPTPAEIERKKAAVRAYASQGDILSWFDAARESYRPIAAHDFSCPPHPGNLNYEAWQWSMTGKEVCLAFSAYLTTLEEKAEHAQ